MAVSPRVQGDGLVKLTILSEGKEIDAVYHVLSVRINKEVNRIPSLFILTERT